MSREVMYPFPVRPGVVAVLHLPPDLSRTEAERLIAFIRSLAELEEEKT